MNIIITGASTGIGRALSLKCAGLEGNRVIAVSRNSEKLAALQQEAPFGNILPVVMDVASYEYGPLHEVLVQQDMKHVDVLVNNAGKLINQPFEQLTTAEWEEVYRVNVFGVAGVIRALLPYMGHDSTSHIVNISSIGGVNGTSKYPGLSAYSSSKGALCTLTECLAEEFRGRGISVNCLALGAVQTEMLTKAFPGYKASMTPEVLSGLIYDFATTGSRYYNGKIIPISTTNP